MVPAEECEAGVLERLQHSWRRWPDEVPAIERGLPCGLEPPVQLCQVGAHLVPPEPAHDGVDSPQSPAVPPGQRAPPGLGRVQVTGQAQPGPAWLTSSLGSGPWRTPWSLREPLCSTHCLGVRRATPACASRQPPPKGCSPVPGLWAETRIARDSQVPQEESM